MKTICDVVIFIIWKFYLIIKGEKIKYYFVKSDFKPDLNYKSDIKLDKAYTMKALVKITKAINNDKIRTVVGYRAVLY